MSVSPVGKISGALSPGIATLHGIFFSIIAVNGCGAPGPDSGARYAIHSKFIVLQLHGIQPR